MTDQEIEKLSSAIAEKLGALLKPSTMVELIPQTPFELYPKDIGNARPDLLMKKKRGWPKGKPRK